MTWTRDGKQEDLMCRYFVMQMVQLATRFERNANFIEYRNSFYSLLILLSKALLDDYDSAENGNIPRARKMMPSSGDTLIKYFSVFGWYLHTHTHTNKMYYYIIPNPRNLSIIVSIGRVTRSVVSFSVCFMFLSHFNASKYYFNIYNI